MKRSKGLNIFKIILDMLKETISFFFAIAIGFINIVVEIID